MKISRLVSILLALTFFGCSDDIQILEERIKTQADLNNTEISSVEIKKLHSISMLGVKKIFMRMP